MDKDRYIAQGIATAPITTSALRQLLKRSHVDTDEVVTDYAPVTPGGLCRHENINSWAKYKPVPFSGLLKKDTFLPDGRWATGDDSGGWWFGDGRGVMSIPTLDGSNEDTLIDSLKSAGAWTHIKPTGGNSSPFRLGDFIGYKHNAQCPVCPYLPDVLYVNNIGNGYGIQLNTTDAYEFTVEELFEKLFVKSGTIQEVYLGVVIRAYDSIYGYRSISEIVGALPDVLDYTITFQENGKDSDNNEYYQLQLNEGALNVIYNTGNTGLEGNNTSIEIGLFITDANEYTYYSPKFDADNIVYKQFALSHYENIIQMSLAIVTEPEIEIVTTDDMYLRSGTDILIADAYVTGFPQGVINATPNKDYYATYLRLYLEQKLTYEGVEESVFDPRIIYDSGMGTITANGRECALTTEITDSYEVYASYEDAYYQRNSTTIQGCPLIVAKALNNSSIKWYTRELLIRGTSLAEDKFTSIRFENTIEI